VEGVIEPNIYDPELNPLYAAMLAFYSVGRVAVSSVCTRCQGKGGIGGRYTQNGIERTALRKPRCSDAFCCTGTKHGPQHVSTARRTASTGNVRARASIVATAAPTRFEYYNVLQRRVHLDATSRSPGPTIPRRRVTSAVKSCACGEALAAHHRRETKQCIREHAATHKGSRRTNDEDRPKQTPRAVLDLVQSIAHSGPSCARLPKP